MQNSTGGALFYCPVLFSISCHEGNNSRKLPVFIDFLCGRCFSFTFTNELYP